VFLVYNNHIKINKNHVEGNNLDKKKYIELQKTDFSNFEWTLTNSLRAFCVPDQYLVKGISVAFLTWLWQKTEDKENSTIASVITEKIQDETTAHYLNNVASEFGNLIFDLTDKFEKDVLVSYILFAEPNRYSSVSEYATPHGIINLAVNILDIKLGDKVMDLGSGLNTFLIAASANENSAKYFGVEINTQSVVVANIRDFVASNDITVVQGDMLSKSFNEIGANKIFSNYPIGMKLAQLKQKIDFNPTLRKYFGSMKRNISSDWIYNFAVLDNLTDSGSAVILMTNSGTWNGSDEMIRKYFVESGYIEGVILLTERLFTGTGIPMTMLVLGKNKSQLVKMVDASAIYTKGRRQNTLEEKDIVHILECYHTDSEFSRTVSIEEIANEEYYLNPQRFILSRDNAVDGIPFEDIYIRISRGAQVKSTELDELATSDSTGLHYLMLQNINEGLIDEKLPSLKSIEPRYEKYCIHNNDLILSKLGSPFKVGLAHVEPGEKILANGNLYCIELDENKINPVFVKAFLESEPGQAQLSKLAKGSAMKSISIRDLNQLLIPNISRKEQEEIAEQYLYLCDDIVILQKQLEKIKDKKANLLNRVEEYDEVEDNK
jgi:type I restriction enzyme M protein